MGTSNLCSQSIRSTGNNLGLWLGSEGIGVGGSSVGLSLQPVESHAISRQCQNRTELWVTQLVLEHCSDVPESPLLHALEIKSRNPKRL